MNKKKISLGVLILLICCFSVFGSSGENYIKFGADSSDYVLSTRNNFLDSSVLDKTYKQGLADANGLPLVDDLDGDGEKEIIVLASNTILIFRFDGNDIIFNTSKTFLGHTLGKENNYFSNNEIIDLDNNGFKEIIFYDELNDIMYFFEYNGTNIINTSLTSFFGVTEDISMIGCYGSSCLIVGSGSGSNRACGFNKTAKCLVTKTLATGGDELCVPINYPIPYGNSKYYFTSSLNYGEFRINSGTINSSLDYNNIGYYLETSPYSEVGKCSGRKDVGYTGVTLGDYDPSRTGLEIGIAYKVADEEFKVSVYDADINFLDESPFGSGATGDIISNVFLARVTSESSSDYNAMCSIGYLDSYSAFGFVNTCRFNVLCSVSSFVDPLGLLYDNLEFKYIYSGSEKKCYNISYNFVNSNFVHSVESDSSSVTSEILTAFGVFDLSDYVDNNCDIAGYCDTYPLFWEPNMMTSYETAFIMADIENNNKLDIVGISNNTLFVIDDSFTNSLPFLDSTNSYVRPSINLDWALGTTIKVGLQVTDLDSPADKVRTKAYLYYDLNASLIETNWTSFEDSGYLFSLTLTENLSTLTTDSILRILVSDIKHNNSYRAYTYYFNVVVNGTTYEENIVSSLGDDPTSYEEEETALGVTGSLCSSSADCSTNYFCNSSVCVALPDIDDNALTDAVNEFSYLTNIPIMVLILLLFGVIAYSVFKEPRIPNNVKIPTTIILCLFGFGISLYLGLISVIWLILLILLILIILAVFIIRFVGR